MDARIIKREKHTRDDGFLVELFSKKYPDFDAVHSYMVSVAPGKTRAGHFHKKKTEVIFPVDGRIIVFLSDDTEKKEVVLDSEEKEYAAVLISPNINHLIENRTNRPAKVVVFSDSFDLEDTYKVEE